MSVTKPKGTYIGIRTQSYEGEELLVIGEVQPSTLFAGTALKDGMVIHSINGIEYKLQRLGRALIEQLEKEPECQITIVASYVSVTVKKPAGGSRPACSSGNCCGSGTPITAETATVETC